MEFGEISIKDKLGRTVILRNKYYNEMMWPERFASCISVEDAIKMMETDT